MDGRVRRGSGILVGLALMLAAPAGAATFTVNSTADAVDATPGNGTCATGTGVCTLRAAVQEANALAGADAITLPPGTFLLSLTGAAEDAAATGDLDVTQALEITGAGPDATIVDGGLDDRVFHVPAAGPALTLRALGVRNGDAGLNPGGGLYHAGGGALALDDVRFRNNRAGIGGGVAKGPGGAFTILASRFDDNIAVGGAGVAHEGGTATLDVRDSAFERNQGGSGGTGGGLVCTGTGGITITNSTFRGNASDRGGGMAALNAAQVTLDGCTFENNRAVGATANAGGASFESVAALTVRNTVVRDNVANANVGGILAQVDAATITGSTFDDNRASAAIGGLYVVGGAGAAVIEDTAFRRNTSDLSVAGGFFVTAGASATLARLVVEDNYALAGAGGGQIAATGDVTVTASRFSRNAAAVAAGGGLAVTSGGTLAIADGLFEDNFAAVGGAAQLVGATVRVTGSTFARNVASSTAGFGGGLLLSTSAGTVENATFSENAATVAGGAIYNGSATVTVSSSTFVGNVAGDTGSVLYDAGPGVTFRGSVLAAGVGTAACAPVAPTSGGDNVDQDGSCGLAGVRDRSGIDPQLGPLQDNGGPTPTHEPLAGSPLIDGDGGTCPATDQRGVARPTDGNGDGTATCDVGAVEFVDECPQDPDKRLPGVCGCGVPDVDPNGNGALDCLVNAELKARIAVHKTSMQAITGVKSDEQTALKSTVKAGADDLLAYIDANGGTIVKADPSADLARLAKKARKAVRKTLKGKGKALQKKQAKAATALDTLDAAVAVQP